jgi:hypothetical protein
VQRGLRPESNLIEETSWSQPPSRLSGTLKDYSGRAGKKGIEWHLVPTGGQHFNRQAERMVGILKKQLHRSLEGRRYTHEETCTLLQ